MQKTGNLVNKEIIYFFKNVKGKLVFKWLQQRLLGTKRVQVCWERYDIDIMLGNDPAYVEIVSV